MELYVQSLFKVSPRYSTRTAPAHEWFELLNMYNEREGHYILTQQQMDTIAPYCDANQDVEMTPEDFIRLLFLIRHDKIHQAPVVESSVRTKTTTAAAKKLLDSRPRSSRLLSRKKYYDEASMNSNNSDRFANSPSHPDYPTNNYDVDIHGDDEDSINHPGIVKYTHLITSYISHSSLPSL